MSLYTIISPAKRLGEIQPTSAMPKPSSPEFESEARRLAGKLASLSVPQLMKLMDISRDLAELNAERYGQFPADLKAAESASAILQFQGDVFQSLNLKDYGSRENEYMNKHVGILSGMYGLLRPFDRMHPYRLEMGTRLSIDQKKNLYEFWNGQITAAVAERMHAAGARVLVNLASDEYSRSVDFTDIGTVVALDFKENRGGKWKVVSYNAKRARGAMLDWIVRKRPGNISALKKFEIGYQFVEETADAKGIHTLVFHKTE